MKSRLLSLLALIIVIFVFASGIYTCITEGVIWLVTLDFNSPNISIFGQIIVKYGTWLITFFLVGILFKGLGVYNSDAMKIVYFIISTFISFLFSWLFYFLEEYSLIILIVIVSLLVTIIIIYSAKERSKEKNYEF